MDEQLTLNDGTEIRGHVSAGTGRIFLYLYGVTLAAAFALLNDPGKVCLIHEEVRGEAHEYSGFTHLRAVSEEMDGQMICADLLKE